MTPPGELTAELQQTVEQSRRQFVAVAAALRPRLHGFCSRMCGGALDGEDVVQEALAEAFYGVGALKDPSRFEAWLFRIAYYKCMDFLRRERRRNDVPLEEGHDHPQVSEGESPADAMIDEALARLVGGLPPMERAAVLLKDVLDHSLAEVAEITDSTVGGVKSALHRGRVKLRTLTAGPALSAFDQEQRRLFDAYAECFNRRDWEGLKHLVRADARLEIVGAAQGRMSGLGGTYSSNYTALPHEWRLSAGVVDGLPVIVHWRKTDSAWEPRSAIRLWFENGQVVRIRDYIHVDYLLDQARMEGAV